MQHRLACVIVVLTISSMALVGMAPIASASSNSLAVAKAKLALIVRTDLPAGWTTSSNGGNSSNTPDAAQLAKCLGTSVSEVNYNPPTANSPEFDQNSDGLSVNDSVSVFPNVKVATEQFDLFNSTRSPACMATWMNSPAMRASFKKGLKAGMNIGEVTAVKVASPPVAAKTIAIKINIPVQDKSLRITVSMDFAIIMSKSMLEGAQLAFTSSVVPFPKALEAHLEAVTAKRLG